MTSQAGWWHASVRRLRFRSVLLACICLLLPARGWLETPPSPSPHLGRYITYPASLNDQLAQLALIPTNHLKSRFRILVSTRPNGRLGQRVVERETLSQFIREQGLEPEWIEMESTAEVLSQLIQGKGDMVITAREEIPAALLSELRLTDPWGYSRQQVVRRVDSGRLMQLTDLTTRQVAVRRVSPAWSTLEALVQEHPTMALVEIPSHMDTEAILDRIESGEYDLAVMDSLALQSSLPHYLTLETAFNLGEKKSMVWGVPSGSERLYLAMNHFLSRRSLESNLARIYRQDLPELQARHLLRVITYQSPVNYFFERGRFKGFEYELIQRFARENGMRLDVVIAHSHDEMVRLLAEGRGDVIAASLPDRSYPGMAINYTIPYSHTAPLIVGRREDAPLIDYRDLQGRRIMLPAVSPYRHLLERIRSQGVDIEIVNADPKMDTEAILFRVAQGMYDLTLIGSHEMTAEFSRQLNLKAHFSLMEPLSQRWAVRRSDSQLLTALNDYIDRQYRNGFYNVLYARYIDNAALAARGSPQLLARAERLSPYDDIVYRYAERYGFDWRLIIAQMYQESRFDTNALSTAGAEGLMQLLPSTAEILGSTDLNDPDVSIHTGIQYLAYLRDLYEKDLTIDDKIWFTLAAYNAGFYRVKQARRRAREMGLRDDKWFDNVEKAMLALGKPYWKDGKVTRVCRCGQAAVYVREIKTLYSNYVRLTRSLKLASADTDLIKES